MWPLLATLKSLFKRLFPFESSRQSICFFFLITAGGIVSIVVCALKL